MSVLPVGFGSSGGLEITNSLRLRASASAYLSRTFGTPTDATKFTLSFRLKRGDTSRVQYLFLSDTGAAYSLIRFDGDDKLTYYDSSTLQYLTTTQVFRDPTAHLHIVFAFDLANGTAANKIKLYINDSTPVSAFSVDGRASMGTSAHKLNTALGHQIGAFTRAGGATYLDGYLSDIYFVDGQALTPSSFGEQDVNGVWVPKAYSGTYGTNGFHLDFKDAALTAGSNVGLGKDVSGNGNYWTTNNISVTAGVTYDSMVDTPTNNYATLNPIVPVNGVTLTDGNLTSSMTTISTIAPRGAIAVSSGKWYWEITKTDAVAAGHNFGIIDVTQAETVNNFTGTNSVGYYSSNGNRYLNGTSAAYGTSYTTNDVIGVELDLDSGTQTIRFYKNNTVQAAGAYINLTSGLTWVPTDNNGGGGTVTAGWNFGQRPFAYTPPTGFLALCTANLPAVAITKPALHFDAKTRTGTGAAFNVTGEAFSPGLVWSKGRSGATDHAIYDAVRGVQKQLESNTTDAESTEAQGVTAFNSDGYSGGTLAQLNTNAATYIDWMWKANGAGSSNTDGSITSTVSANQTAGFSIVAYTGNGTNGTVGHGLGATPAMFIVKKRSVASSAGWMTYHKNGNASPQGGDLYLNTTHAWTSDTTPWNNTQPTSTVFTVGPHTDTNAPSATYVAYCFAEIPGYSKFGSYTGNGSADGPFVYCGFRPGFIWTKDAAGVNHWFIFDTARNTYNVVDLQLEPNLSNAEAVNTTALDVLATGFKLRNAGGGINTSSTFVFAAFAEHPFGGSNCSPSPAR